jgi:glucose/arabinose dehydrogenase
VNDRHSIGPLRLPTELRVALVLVVGSVVAAGCSGETQPSATGASGASHRPPSIPLDVTIVQENLSIPWDVAFAPDGRMYVSERLGRIQVFASGEPGAEHLETVEVQDVHSIGEAGVMGLAVDKDFSNFPFLYVCASRDPDDDAGAAPWINELLRYRVTDTSLEFEGPVFDSTIRANRQHNGCAVETDDDGHIWMTVGDALTRMNGLSQLNNLNGKVLRLNRDGTPPDDNPIMFDDTEPGLIYTIGHRNPQGITFEPQGGQPYTAEHGPTTNDEINRLVAGGNYGWPCYVATDYISDESGGHETLNIDCGPPEDYLGAAWASGEATIATSNLVFLTGDRWGEWTGDLIVATLKEMELRRFELDAGGNPQSVEALLDEEYGRLRAAVIGPDGALYVTTSNARNNSGQGVTPAPEDFSDVIIRIAPSEGD